MGSSISHSDNILLKMEFESVLPDGSLSGASARVAAGSFGAARGLGGGGWLGTPFIGRLGTPLPGTPLLGELGGAYWLGTCWRDAKNADVSLGLGPGR
jgi:hypothetical protein